MRWLFFALVLFYSSAFSRPIVLATHDLFPYGSYPDDLAEKKMVSDASFSGVAVDRVRCSFNKMNVKLKVLVVPWKRAQILAENGEVDGFFAGSQNSHRDSYAVMSDIIAEQKWQWYWLKSNHQNPNSDLFKRDARIGAFLGSNMMKWVKKQGFTLYSTPLTTEHLFLQLLSHRVDVIIANNLVMKELIYKHNVLQKIESRVVKNKPLGVYFTNKAQKENPGLITRFNQALHLCYENEPEN